jgi:TPR repeat protein
MSSPKRAALFSIVVAAAVAASGLAHAFDAKSFEKEKRSPWAVFRLGFSAYKKGDKEEAVEAYRYAADKGQVGASWKLAKMYASGDGVPRDDYQAYKFFSQIVDDDVRPGSPDESYVSDALVALGNYSRTGIPGSPVAPNLSAAQDFYMRAAATYRNPVAQFELGKMFLYGEGVKASIRQAGRWLQLAAEKGHAGAQATLGNLLFQSGKIVRGLAMMTEALSHAPAADLPWIRQMQEEAFALAGEGDRRTAIALADSMRDGGDDGK